MKIAIIGAGNIGTYLATYISLKENTEVFLHTSKTESFYDEIELIEEEKNIIHKTKLKKVSSSIRECVENADYILITHPSFMAESTIKEIIKYAKEGSIIGTIPGFGGKEFYIKDLLDKGIIYFGTQRVPSITRLNSYGKSVTLKQKNNFMKISVIPKEYTNKVCNDMTSFIDIPCLPLKSYLSIALSPSNPTMHPSRLYELFKDYKEGVFYDENPLFYETWGYIASKTLLDLDDELKNIFNKFNEYNDFYEYDFEKIKIRYNIETPDELSKKINTAPGFLGIYSPMIKVDNKYIPDLNSRYFTEDIDFGLCILKSFAEILEVDTPTIDKLIIWAQNLFNKEFIVDGKLIGKDAKKLVTPITLGITNKKDLISFYKNL